MAVAVFIGLLTPGGQIYTLSPYGQRGWSSAIEPWIPSIDVPSNFNLNRTPLITIQLPSDMPPIISPGAYNLAALLTLPGSFTPVSSLSLAPFNIIRWSEMVEIPAGHFLMGSPEDEVCRRDHEKRHEVTLTKDFYIGIFEVTQKQWEHVMGFNPSHYEGEKLPVDTVSWNENVRGGRWP